MRRLVIAPHMDDESLGCGGLLAKYAVRRDRRRGHRQRRGADQAEHRQALDILGVLRVALPRA